MSMPQGWGAPYPLALYYQALLANRVKADSLKKTMYTVINELYTDYLRAQLLNCRIPALKSENPKTISSREGLVRNLTKQFLNQK